MPQLDIATYLPQLFWLAVSFVVLYLLMSRVALPRVGGAIHARRERIEADLERAENLQAEAKVALAAYEKAMAEARDRAHRAVREAEEAIKAREAEQDAEASERLGGQLAAAEVRIAEARTAALADLNKVAAGLAREVVAKVSGLKTTARTMTAAVKATAPPH